MTETAQITLDAPQFLVHNLQHAESWLCGTDGADSFLWQRQSNDFFSRPHNRCSLALVSWESDVGAGAGHRLLIVRQQIPPNALASGCRGFFVRRVTCKN